MIRFVLTVFLLSAFSLFSQTQKKSSLGVFIDCQTQCDFTFIKSEIRQVDFLMDRLAAEVHVLITSQNNGGGGNEYQIIFFGQNGFKMYKDTIQYSLEPNATLVERRGKMVNQLRVGLIPYLIKKGITNHLIVNEDRALLKKDSTLENKKDPWNYWSIRVGANGSLRFDQVYVQHSLNTTLSVSQVTALKKIRFWFRAGDDEEKYFTTDSLGNRNVRIVQNELYNVYHENVRGINDHWSFGYIVSLFRNTFSNFKYGTSFSPALEYSFFPYPEVNNRFLTFRYGAETRYNVYYDTTIYDKMEEYLWAQRAVLNLVLNQKWGNINSGVQYRNYFHDWEFFRLSISSGINVRITGGLSFNIDLYAGLEHDQINLVKKEATLEEVLTRRRQLASNYRLSSSFGINYRFGSKFNNFVNPRFDD